MGSAVCIRLHYQSIYATQHIYLHTANKTLARGHGKLITGVLTHSSPHQSMNCHRQQGVPNPLVPHWSVCAVTYSVNNLIPHDRIKRPAQEVHVQISDVHIWVTVARPAFLNIPNVFFLIDSLKHQISLWSMSFEDGEETPKEKLRFMRYYDIGLWTQVNKNVSQHLTTKWIFCMKPILKSTSKIKGNFRSGQIEILYAGNNSVHVM